MNRLRVRSAEVELEVENHDGLTPEDVKSAFESLERLRGFVGLPASTRGAPLPSATAERPVAMEGLDASLNTYVSRLGGGSCRALLKAAGVHLTLTDGVSVFPKSALFDRAREAHEWQRDFANQQARDLKRMVASKEMIEKSGGSYAVASRILKEASEKLKDLSEE